MYRSMTLFRNLLTPLPCSVEDAALLSHDDIVEIYGVRPAFAPRSELSGFWQAEPRLLLVRLSSTCGGTTVCMLGRAACACAERCSPGRTHPAGFWRAQMYVAALMDCMRGPVDDMMSPSYQRLRQLIEAHVRAPRL